MRRGELLALRWRDVELDGKEPSLRVREAVEETKAGLRLKTPKTENSVREISLPDIVEALRELVANSVSSGLRWDWGNWTTAPYSSLASMASLNRREPSRRNGRTWQRASGYR